MTTLCLKIVRGNSASFDIAVTTIDSTGATIVADLTGSTPSFTAKISEFETAVIFKKTVGAGITVIDAINGELRLDLIPADTAIPEVTSSVPNPFGANYPDAFYVYLNLSFSGGFEYTAAAGALAFNSSAPYNYADA